MRLSPPALVTLALSALLPASSAADPAQLVLQPAAAAASSRAPAPNLRGVKHCAVVPGGAHPAAAVPQVRTSLRVDPDRGWGVVFAELLDPRNPGGEPLAALGMVNHDGARDRVDEHEDEVVQEWKWLLPGLTPGEVEAMVSCAAVRIREGWHAPLPRKPEVCALRPLSHDGTPTFLQTSLQFDTDTFKDQIVVHLYPSLERAEAATRLLADAPREWFEAGFGLFADEVAFGSYPSSRDKWARIRVEHVAGHVEAFPEWRTAEELGAMVDCAQARAEKEAGEKVGSA